MNDFSEKRKCIIFMASLGVEFLEICRGRPYWVMLAIPAKNHGAYISFASWNYFNSLRPYDKTAADIFKKFIALSKVETFRTVSMGTDSTQSTQD